MRFVAVYWFDSSVAKAEVLFDKEEVENYTPCEVISCGILAREDKKCVVLAKDYFEESYRGISLIPKVNITKIKRI